jgi:hypothetical protein
VSAYRERYDAYFDANKARAREKVTKLDTFPRVLLVPGVGNLHGGADEDDARIAADITEHTLRSKAQANDIGRYVALSDADLFDMEYWVLEQAKLGKGTAAPLAGQGGARSPGAAGAIGFGISKQLLAAGAHVVLSDVDAARVPASAHGARSEGEGHRPPALVMDVTDEASVAAGMDEVCRLYGGLGRARAERRASRT